MVANTMRTGLEAVHHHWGWFLTGGIAFILLGIAALIYAFGVTVITVAFFGWLLIISGLVHIVEAFRARGWSGVLLHLFGGILEIVVGIIVAASPLRGALAITMVLAAYLMVGGLFRIFGAMALGFKGAGWMALGGAVSLLLGLALWWGWPVTGLWFIGTAVGVDLILQGSTWISIALNARHVHHLPEAV